MVTELCRTLGIEQPILCAPMGGGIAGPELAAAVSNAGGLGLMGLIAVPPPIVAELLARLRALTAKPFGAGVILDVPGFEEQIPICLEARIPVLVTFWGDPKPWVADAHARGTKVIAQIGSVDEAVAAARAGVDAVIAQGVEAGGHVRGTTPLAELLPPVVAGVKPLPVIAAGGIADRAGVQRALEAGAQAAMLGTRFLASEEANVDAVYKRRIVEARAGDTVLTKLFDIGWPNAPHRVLRNRVVREWEAAGRPESGRRPGEGTIVGHVTLGGQRLEVPRYDTTPPMPGFEGDPEDWCLYAGESSALVNDIRPAAEIVKELVKGL
jgi:nitronate monooxygenase